MIKIEIPDLGGVDHLEVTQLHVKIGDTVKKDEILLTLESEKASIELPMPVEGKITALFVKPGDLVTAKQVVAEALAAATAQAQQEASQSITKSITENKNIINHNLNNNLALDNNNREKSAVVYASPLVRRIAREFEIQLENISGTGIKNRITREDLENYNNYNHKNNNINNKHNLTLTTEIVLSKINKASAKHLHSSWTTIPHVTQFDEIDITELENFRNSKKTEAEKQNVRLTLLVFILKAIISVLKIYPKFNASLSDNQEKIILKNYYNIAVAVDTENGLVTPVIRDIDQKNLWELSRELGEISQKARENKLSPQDLHDHSFTISSLGGIGGTAFTPIINLPDTAILGISKAVLKPIYNSKINNFEPKLILPISLSYDHRVIDGALAARFTQSLSHYLSDIRNLLL